jgi:hypothetical protein
LDKLIGFYCRMPTKDIKRKRKQRYYFSFHRMKRRKPLFEDFDYDSAPKHKN